MPFNGAGTFTVYTPGNPIANGDTSNAVYFNNTMTDFATGLSNTMTRDGQGVPTANIPMGNNKITGLANGTISTDASNYGQILAINTSLSAIKANAGANTDITALANSSGIVYVPRADVAVNTTINLTSVADNIRLTGSGANVSLFAVPAGRNILTTFNGTNTLVNSANLTTQTGANITTAAGDTCIIRANPANVVEVMNYVKASTLYFNVGTVSMVRLNTANGHGSTNTCIRRFTNVVTNQGSDITYADSATLGATFTINTNGVYAISYSDTFTGNDPLGISLNSTQLSTSISSITGSDVLSYGQSPGASSAGAVSSVVFLVAGSVVRAHTGGTAGTTSKQQFTITRVA